MFEDKYKQEMKQVHASESLISDTLKKMQDEREKMAREASISLTETEPSHTDTISSAKNLSSKGTKAVASTPSAKSKKSLWRVIAFPAAAACVVMALLGVFLVGQNTGDLDLNRQEELIFQPVEGSIVLSGGLQFGNVEEQGENYKLNRTECLEVYLPQGILEAQPSNFNDHSVYLGYDERQASYYAVYQEDASGNKPEGASGKTWVVLQSNKLDKQSFIEAIKKYFK